MYTHVMRSLSLCFTFLIAKLYWFEYATLDEKKSFVIICYSFSIFLGFVLSFLLIKCVFFKDYVDQQSGCTINTNHLQYKFSDTFTIHLFQKAGNTFLIFLTTEKCPDNEALFKAKQS